ncbi:MAG: SAM-dependent chlorinase/fluorinase, partial [Chloroflexi bacterium]|nr:SAM-dependent chlorinase/fluorinase [Chloroflexota bacterium]
MATITLTTDFGLQDAYVAAMKGVILGINPDAAIVDICHTIRPQNIAQAAFVLSTACSYFPKDTIHVLVVDPEVGSPRRAVVLKTEDAFFVAPDNGLLSYVVLGSLLPEAGTVEGVTPLPSRWQAVEITSPRFWRQPVSSTFHGRDIFAPVAAHLSLGVPLKQFGSAIRSLRVLPVPRPHPGEAGELVGHVLHIDGFGNVITDLREEDLPTGEFHVHVAGQRIALLGTTYR